MILYNVKLKYRDDLTGKTKVVRSVCGMKTIQDMLEQCEIDGHSIVRIRIERTV